MMSPQKARECLKKAYSGDDIGDLSEQCRDALSRIPENIQNIDPDGLPISPPNHVPNGGPPCFYDVMNFCEPEERGNFQQVRVKCTLAAAPPT